MPVPATERVKAGPWAGVLFGEKELITGVGREVGTLRSKVDMAEVDAELETVTLTEPGIAISA